MGAAEIIAALDSAGIPSILLKGPAIATWLYDERESRNYGDVDLMVSPAQLARAEEIVAELGFAHLRMESNRPDEESGHEIWHRDADGVTVELHRAFFGIGVGDQEAWDVLDDQTEPLSLRVGKSHARALAPGARALIVGLHAAAHGPVGKPVRDLERALERLPPGDWERAAELARRLGAEGAFRVGLSRLSAGRDLAARLGLAGETSTEVLLRAGGAPPTAMGFEALTRRHGARAKLRYLATELWPSPEFLRAADPIASRGRLGLAAAYLRRPMRLGLAAPAGLRSWRAARRQAEADRS